LPSQRGDVQTGGAAEREERKAPRIQAAPHRHQANALRHVGVDQAKHTLGGRDARHAQPLCEPIDRPLRRSDIEANATAQEVVGIEIAEHEIRVGDGRRLTTLAVARGPRLGARALGPHAEDASFVHTRDGSAARAQRNDVEARQRHAVSAHFPVARHLRLAAHDDGDIRAGAAHVERDEIAFAQEPGCIASAGNTARGARQHRAGGEAYRFGNRSHAAVRLHDENRPAIACALQSIFEPRQVVAQYRPDVGVDYGRTDALVFLDLRQHLGGDRHVGVRHRARDGLSSGLFVARVLVGVQEADAHRLDLVGDELSHGAIERCLVERRIHAAVGTNALANAQASRARNEWIGRRHPQVVAIGLEAFAHLENVTMTIRGDEAHARALAFEQRVRRGRRPMNDALGFREQLRKVRAHFLRQALKSVHHADRLIGWRGRGLRERDLAFAVDRDEIRERASHIDAYAVHAVPCRSARADESVGDIRVARLRRSLFRRSPPAAPRRFDQEH
jgi:hypothetical protein